LDRIANIQPSDRAFPISQLSIANRGVEPERNVRRLCA
jgi:hypothetical protein